MRRCSLLVLFIITLLSSLAFVSGAFPSTQTPPAQAKVADKTSERLDLLENRAKELDDKIDHATQKNDYIKQYETYYERAFSTQLQILGILGIILTVLLFIAGRFGLSIFDRQIQLQLKSATDTLRSEFEGRLGEQLRSLSEKNTAQLKELEDGLKGRIAVLDENLELRSNFQYTFPMGTSAYVDEVYDSALKSFRGALEQYKKGKDRGTVPRSGGVTTLRFIFYAIKAQGEPAFAQRAKQELENKVYQSLDEELMQVADQFPPLLPLLKK